MPTIVDKLKELKVKLSEEQAKAVAEIEAGYRDQETIDKAVVAAKTKTKEKVLKDFLKDFGVSTPEELRAKLTAKPEKPAEPTDKKPDSSTLNADIQKVINEQQAAIKALKTSLEAQEQKLVRKDQIEILRSKGFTLQQADKMHKTLSAQTSDEKDFNAVLSEAEKDPLFKGSFDFAANQLKAGTISIQPKDNQLDVDDALKKQLDDIWSK